MNFKSRTFLRFFYYSYTVFQQTKQRVYSMEIVFAYFVETLQYFVSFNWLLLLPYLINKNRPGLMLFFSLMHGRLKTALVFRSNTQTVILQILI